MKNKLTIYGFIFFICLPASSFAADYYVSNDGDDSDAGTEAAPFASLYKAYDTISVGDTIYLNRGDTWTVTVNRDSSEEVGVGLWIRVNSITIDAYGTGALPIIDASTQSDVDNNKATAYYAPIQVGESTSYNPTGVTISNLDLRGPDFGQAVAAYRAGNDLTISGITASVAGCSQGESMITMGNQKDRMTLENNTINVANCDQGMQLYGGDSPTVSGNEFYNFGTRGIYVETSLEGTITIENNYVHSPATPPAATPWNWAIAMRELGAGASSTVIVRNNVVDLRGATPSGDNLRGLTLYMLYDDLDLHFYNNTIVSDGDGYGAKFFANTAGINYYVFNNIFYDLQEGLDNIGSYTHSRNNIYYSTPTLYDGTPGTDSNNVTTDPNIADDTMVSVTGAMLTASSANAIDNGYAVGAYIPTYDYAGNSRSTIDIGAYEYGASASGNVYQSSGAGSVLQSAGSGSVL